MRTTSITWMRLESCYASSAPSKVLISKGDPRDYRGVGIKRTMVTAIECISANGRSLLPIMIIWPATTHRSNWTTFPTPAWYYACSESGYTDSKISLEWLTRVFDPQTRRQANQKPRVLICDGFGTHETFEILEFCLENNIQLVLYVVFPLTPLTSSSPVTSESLPPLEGSVSRQAERLYQGGTNAIGKEHFTSLYSPARESAFTKRSITAAWAASGLFPFNPDRVLGATPKPPARSTIPNTDDIKVGTYSQDEVQTPVTPMSAEALTALHNLIKQDAHTLNETSIQRLQRHVQKLANAVQISFAERALLHDHNQFLNRINDEAKVRRLTKSVVLGRAKVMSYEDIEEARATRAAKKVIEGKGKRGRKRKIAALEAGDSEPELEPKVGAHDRSARARESTSGADVLKCRLWKTRLLQEE